VGFRKYACLAVRKRQNTILSVVYHNVRYRQVFLSSLGNILLLEQGAYLAAVGWIMEFGAIVPCGHNVRSGRGPTRPATVHRTVAFRWFESHIHCRKKETSFRMSLFFWQRYYKLIQCTALWGNAPAVFRSYPRDNRDRKDTIFKGYTYYSIFQKKGRASYLTAEITGSAFLLIRQIRENKAITDHFQELLFLGESIENHSLIRDFCCCKRFPL
jgi:hypothetical protein